MSDKRLGAMTELLKEISNNDRLPAVYRHLRDGEPFYAVGVMLDIFRPYLRRLNAGASTGQDWRKLTDTIRTGMCTVTNANAFGEGIAALNKLIEVLESKPAAATTPGQPAASAGEPQKTEWAEAARVLPEQNGLYRCKVKIQHGPLAQEEKVELEFRDGRFIWDAAEDEPEHDLTENVTHWRKPPSSGAAQPIQAAAPGLPAAFTELRDKWNKTGAAAGQPSGATSLDEISEYLDSQGIPAFEPLKDNEAPLMYTMLERVQMLRVAQQPTPDVEQVAFVARKIVHLLRADSSFVNDEHKTEATEQIAAILVPYLSGEGRQLPDGKLPNYDTPETIVDHIVGMVADDGSITDYARELAVDYVRTRIAYAANPPGAGEGQKPSHFPLSVMWYSIMHDELLKVADKLTPESDIQKLVMAELRCSERMLCALAETEPPAALTPQKEPEFTSGYVQEVKEEISGPRCKVCGAVMVHEAQRLSLELSGKWKCLSCGETTVYTDPEPKEGK